MKTLIVLIFILILSGLNLNVSAQRRPNQYNNSLDDAIREVKRKSPGRILSAETRQREQQQYHQIRVLTEDGKVKRYRIDEADRNRRYR